jgi:4-hydroxybenzoate polyprenyltransferase
MFRRFILYLKMIKLSHSVFALPFAFTGAVLASGGLPSLRQSLWIAAAMVGARSGAMGLNRIIDRNIDALNPRTKDREIPAGKIKVTEAYILVFLSFVLFIFSAYKLNPLCLMLSPLALVMLFLYSYTKRFTWASHFALGSAISVAPLGGWIAVRGTFDIGILPLAFAVLFWLAGFDTLYALQDIEFDKSHGLHSIPKRFGIRGALVLSRAFHTVAFALLSYTGFIFGLGPLYWAGLAVVAGLLIYEHSLVKADDLSRLDMAFFNMNGYISVAVFVFTSLDFFV